MTTQFKLPLGLSSIDKINHWADRYTKNQTGNLTATTTRQSPHLYLSALALLSSGFKRYPFDKRF